MNVQPLLAQSADGEVDDEPTCSLDSSKRSGCSTYEATHDDLKSKIHDGSDINRRDLTRQVISLTDETFDDIALTTTPSTWLIMFKTDACAICKKAKPVLENLSVDADILNHNDKELAAINSGDTNKQQPKEPPAKEEEGGTPKGPVYVYEEPTDGGEIPKGPVYIATVDASWSGRDTAKRFDVDATPTILVLRNEGYHDNEKVDSRSYYIYRGQRAIYPLRGFVLGGFAMRKKMEMPPPLTEFERKPISYLVRVYDYFISPAAKWAGGIIVKILLAWFVFVGLLGVGMRIHNYSFSWSDKDDEEREKELEREKAEGRKNASTSAEERSAERQKAMWERKAKNHAKFTANREARKKKSDNEGEDDDELVGVGISVKKADTTQKAPSKLKDK